MKYTRLQGNKWIEKKNELKLVRYIVSLAGNIRGDYRDILNNRFCHWLNDNEKIVAQKQIAEGGLSVRYS